MTVIGEWVQLCLRGFVIIMDAKTKLTWLPVFIHLIKFDTVYETFSYLGCKRLKNMAI